jgi:hypothetical protein
LTPLGRGFETTLFQEYTKNQPKLRKNEAKLSNQISIPRIKVKLVFY